MIQLGKKPYEGQKYEVFQVSGEDDDGTDIMCPYIQYIL